MQLFGDAQQLSKAGFIGDLGYVWGNIWNAGLVLDNADDQCALEYYD